MKLKGKVIVITGGTRGIGRGVALELAKEGAILVLNYVKDDEAALKVLEEIKALGVYCELIKGDVGDYKFSQNMINDVINRLGKIDVLINNAAISKIGLFMDTKESDFEEMINTNFKSVFNTANAVISHMLSRGQGSIINMSSMWGDRGASCEVLYSATKGAINSFTKALAKEVGNNKVRVNAVAPGVINTEMNNWLDADEKEALIEAIPMGEFGEVSDIGKAIVFLASDDSRYITGEILNVNGGF